MCGLTVLGFFESASFIFAHGSDGLMRFSVANKWLQVLFVLAFISMTLVYRKRKVLIVLVVLSTLFFIWFFSGRVISTFPNGKIGTGWFYFETTRHDMCQNVLDCEKSLYYETLIEELPFWRIRIHNKQNEQTIYIGPFIWKKTLTLLKNDFLK